MRLLSKIVVKEFTEDNCFLVDLEDEEEVFYKCEDVFSELVQHIYTLENFTEDGLVAFLSDKYPDVEKEVLGNDVKSFISFLQEKNFLSE